ncbi:MAG: toxin-activating lysine-acyltransferase [Alphaproteobacteria bacterium]
MTTGSNAAVAATDNDAAMVTEGQGAGPSNGVVPASGAVPGRPGQSPFASLMGDITWLMVRSSTHKHLFLADLEWLVLPAVTSRLFRLFVNGATPYAYVSWAFLDEEAETRLLSGQPRLRPGDWRSGDRAWIIDIVAPFGGGDAIPRSIKAQFFMDRTLKALRPRGDGKGFEGVEVVARETPPAGDPPIDRSGSDSPGQHGGS